MLKLEDDVVAITVIDKKELDDMFRQTVTFQGDLGFKLKEYLEMVGWTLNMRRRDPDCLMDISYELVESYCLQTRTLTAAMDLLAMANDELEHQLLRTVERLDPHCSAHLSVGAITNDAVIFKLIHNPGASHECI